MRVILFVMLGATVLASPALSDDRVVLPVPIIHRTTVLLPTVPPLRTAARDSFQVIAQILATRGFTFGDTDHDGLHEVILAVADDQVLSLSLRILEYQADGMYHQEFVGPYMNPYATGDLDRDGKSEILGQVGNLLVLYEARTPSSYPDTLVWQSPPLTNVESFTTIGDTDRDGKMEIVHSANTFGSSRLIIYENTGDNTFVERYSSLIDPDQVDGPKVIADLDGDGLLEIAFSGLYGYVHIVESPSNDVWQEIFTDTTGLENAYPATGGIDTDGNGKPELFVAGDLLDPFGDNTYVYEAIGDNSFARVATLVVNDDATGGLHNVVANTQGVNRPEYVLAHDRHLRVFHAVAPGEWILSVSILDPPPALHSLLAAFDVNRNGRDELFWACTGLATATCNTLVLESPGISPSDVEFPPPRAMTTLRVSPTPCRGATVTVLADSRTQRSATVISTFDVSGRLVLRERVSPGTAGAFSVPVSLLRPGLYLLRVEDRSGQPLATGRTIVLR